MSTDKKKETAKIDGLSEEIANWKPYAMYISNLKSCELASNGRGFIV